MDILNILSKTVCLALEKKFSKEYSPEQISFQPTRPEFEGDYTLVVFPFSKLGIGSPEEIGNQIGHFLTEECSAVKSFNVVKGFLNVSLTDSFWASWMAALNMAQFPFSTVGKGKIAVVEFPSPNTNKPLHLGHLRNCFLGDSVSRILKAGGYEVKNVCLYNDRGIAICKSMLMYAKEGNASTPESTGMKPDFFVVQFYLAFGEQQREEVAAKLSLLGVDTKDARVFMLGKKVFGNELIEDEIKEAKKRTETFIASNKIKIETLENETPVMQEAREMLLKWEAGDPSTIALWKKMNDWVYTGFNGTYDKIGIRFDKNYYESETWKLGNSLVDEGLEKEIFFKKEDGSVWIDLSADGLDMKVLRRSDGTAMYITQDLGSAQIRYQDFKMDTSLYVVGNEQEYHFKVLKLVLQKLGRQWADGIFHLSYGMVDLPAGMGRMKTREGTAVDADDLINEVIASAGEKTQELGKREDLGQEEFDKLVSLIGLAALKFFILRVDPKKGMVFDPNESVNLHGDTGPFVQYSFARIQSVLRKAGHIPEVGPPPTLETAEKVLLRQISTWPEKLNEAIESRSPSVVANFALDLAKSFNRFYHEIPVLTSENPSIRAFRLNLCQNTGILLHHSLGILGIGVPEKM